MKNREYHKHSVYWEERAKALERMSHDRAKQYADSIQKAFRKASAQMQREIESWYQRFADSEGISMQEAKRLLNTRELEEFRWDVEDYIQAGKENAVSGKWMKQLENASARVHISRLEALQLQLQQKSEQLFQNHLDSLDKLIRTQYQEAYYHTAFDLMQGTSVGVNFNRFDEGYLDKLLSRPWTADGKTFSDRVWENQEKLLDTVQTELIQAAIRGESPKKTAKAVEEAMGVSANRAKTLVYTESAYFTSRGTKDTYETLGVEQYEILATLDRRTSEICRSLDGKHLPLNEYKPGITAPPFHPNCRTTTVPYFEDDIGERIARNADRETYYVPGDMTYREWENKYVKPAEQSLTPSEKTATIKLTEQEERALNEYISSGSYKINAVLREGAPLSDEQKQMVKSLDTALTKMPVYKGEVIRSLMFDKDGLIEFAKKHSIGEKITYTAYTSASTLTANYHEKPTVLLKILSKTGRDIRAYNPEESEILFPRNTNFRIISVKLEDGIFTIEMEEKS